jgi:hypothetical protein
MTRQVFREWELLGRWGLRSLVHAFGNLSFLKTVSKRQDIRDHVFPPMQEGVKTIASLKRKKSGGERKRRRPQLDLHHSPFLPDVVAKRSFSLTDTKKTYIIKNDPPQISHLPWEFGQPKVTFVTGAAIGPES